MVVLQGVENTIRTKNLKKEVRNWIDHGWRPNLTMATSSASLERGKTSGVERTTGFREASPKPREVANMPGAQSKACCSKQQVKYHTVHTPDAVKNDASTSRKNSSFLVRLIRLVVSGDLNNRILLHENGSAVSSIGDPKFMTSYETRSGRAPVLSALNMNVSCRKVMY